MRRAIAGATVAVAGAVVVRGRKSAGGSGRSLTGTYELCEVAAAADSAQETPANGEKLQLTLDAKGLKQKHMTGKLMYCDDGRMWTTSDVVQDGGVESTSYSGRWWTHSPIPHW